MTYRELIKQLQKLNKAELDSDVVIVVKEDGGTGESCGCCFQYIYSDEYCIPERVTKISKINEPLLESTIDYPVIYFPGFKE